MPSISYQVTKRRQSAIGVESFRHAMKQSRTIYAIDAKDQGEVIAHCMIRKRRTEALMQRARSVFE